MVPDPRKAAEALPWGRGKLVTFSSRSSAPLLQELPQELLLKIADRSMTMYTKLALTCKGIKKIMVKGARARKGLRLSTRGMRLAVRAQKAGLFDVAQVHLARWERTVSEMIYFCKSLPKVSLITIPPTIRIKYYERRASSLVSYKLRRHVRVRSRTCASSSPWQRQSAAFLLTWLGVGKGPNMPAAQSNTEIVLYTSSDDDEPDRFIPEDPTLYNLDPLGWSTSTYDWTSDEQSPWSGDEDVLVSSLVPGP